MKKTIPYFILAILAMIFGELTWWSDMLWLRKILLAPILPIAILLSRLHVDIHLRPLYLVQWAIPILILYLISRTKRIKENGSLQKVVTWMAVSGTILFLLYLSTYIVCRFNGTIEFERECITDHGGWGSGKTYTVSKPVIDGSVYLEILYPLASFEGNHFHLGADGD